MWLNQELQPWYDGWMSADQVIEQIRSLSRPDDLEKISNALEEHRAELVDDAEAEKRIDQLRSGNVKALTHEEVFASTRSRIREG
jgi:hypothetical protein